GFTSNLVCLDPVEWFNLYIRMLIVFDKKVECVFVECVTLTDDRVGFEDLAGQLIAMRKLPRVHGCRRIVFYMYNVTTSLEYERLQALFAQFLSRPTATHAGADDDGVKCIFVFTRSVNVYGGRILAESISHDYSCRLDNAAFGARHRL